MNKPAHETPVYRVRVVEKDEQDQPGIIQCRIGINISFDLEALASYCSTDYEPVIVDLLLLAAAVEFCDRTLRRRSGEWARNVVLQLPVYCVDRWAAPGVSNALTEVLNFLTGDIWHVKFSHRKFETSLPSQRPLSLPLNASAVIPFSDGLDSWAVATICNYPGRAELIQVRLKSKRLSGKSSDPYQRFTLVPYNVRAGSNQQPETTGRSRGFKFGVIGGVAAYLARVNTVIVSESGQGALGPVLAPLAHTHPDYRSHPLFTMRMERFLEGLLGRPIRYDFPRLWHTKGETLRTALERAKEPNGWRTTRSCWQGNRCASVKDSVWAKGTLRQCGVCAACLLRRLSVHSAGLNEAPNSYVWENLETRSFRDGAASTFSKTVKPFQDYAIAGAMLMDRLAVLSTLGSNQIILRRHALELSHWRGERPDEIEIRLRRLLDQHAEEWRDFVASLGPESFIRPWAEAAA
jgi:7-cyano-7-deazaguanine synthase in queuosine biosynthesis